MRQCNAKVSTVAEFLFDTGKDNYYYVGRGRRRRRRLEGSRAKKKRKERKTISERQFLCSMSDTTKQRGWNEGESKRRGWRVLDNVYACRRGTSGVSENAVKSGAAVIGVGVGVPCESGDMGMDAS
jgi:hypothetical protein